jgi:hypothetical protein
MGRIEDANALINGIKRDELSAKILHTDPDLHREIVAGVGRGDDDPIDAHLDDDSILEMPGEEL